MIETVADVLKAPMAVLGVGGVLIGVGILLSGVRPGEENDTDRERQG